MASSVIIRIAPLIKVVRLDTCNMLYRMFIAVISPFLLCVYIIINPLDRLPCLWVSLQKLEGNYAWRYLLFDWVLSSVSFSYFVGIQLRENALYIWTCMLRNVNDGSQINFKIVGHMTRVVF